MEQGWVKVHRQLLDNHFLMKDNNAYIVFTKLLLMVNKKGEIAAGRRQLADLMYMNDRTLYGILVRLENQGMIKIESMVRYSVIHIKNWATYQQNANRGGNETATEDATLAKQGSIAEVATDMTTTAQPQRNSSATTAQHSNKKEIKKEKKNNSSELATRSYGNPEINEMFSYWEQTIGYRIEGNVAKNRNACSNLLKKHKREGVIRLINGILLTKEDQFAPRIADFIQLQFKYNEFIAWGQTNRRQSGLEIIV
jgi:hypothetical protein